MVDFAVRWGDTLKVHTGRLTSGIAPATNLPAPYTPPAGATLKMVVRTQAIGGGSPGARVELQTSLAGDGTWERVWTTANFTAMSALNPAAAVMFEAYFELIDGTGKKITFPDDSIYTLSLMPAF